MGSRIHNQGRTFFLWLFTLLVLIYPFFPLTEDWTFVWLLVLWSETNYTLIVQTWPLCTPVVCNNTKRFWSTIWITVFFFLWFQIKHTMVSTLISRRGTFNCKNKQILLWQLSLSHTHINFYLNNHLLQHLSNVVCLLEDMKRQWRTAYANATTKNEGSESHLRQSYPVVHTSVYLLVGVQQSKSYRLRSSCPY
jgi:hypothetical protein